MRRQESATSLLATPTTFTDWDRRLHTLIGGYFLIASPVLCVLGLFTACAFPASFLDNAPQRGLEVILGLLSSAASLTCAVVGFVGGYRLWNFHRDSVYWITAASIGGWFASITTFLFQQFLEALSDPAMLNPEWSKLSETSAGIIMALSLLLIVFICFVAEVLSVIWLWCNHWKLNPQTRTSA